MKAIRRVAVIGVAGAGKSTLARQIGPLLDLPVIHLDRLFWQPDWRPTPRERWRETQAGLVRGDRWIIDGNYDSTLEIRLAAADTIVFLDFPAGICIARVLWRALRPGQRTRADIDPGCVERPWRRDFWLFLWWIACYRRKNRPRVLRMVAQHGRGKRVFILDGPRQVARFGRWLGARARRCGGARAASGWWAWSDRHSGDELRCQSVER